MKKLLCGFFAVTLVSSSSLLVSSNSVTNTAINKNILKIKSQSLKSINKKVSPIDEIIKIFENGIDGSFLTDHNNFNDGLKVFQKVAASISSSISVKLAAGVSPTKYLSVGPNSINLSVSDGQNTVQVNGIIKNVQNYDKSILNKVISFLNQGINGSDYTTKTTYESLALVLTNLLQSKFNDKNLSLKVTNTAENNKTLNAGTNKIDFTVVSGKATKNDTVTISNVPKESNYTWLWVSLGILLTIGLGVAIYYIVKAIEKYINNNHFQEILNLLTNGISGSQFNDGNTQGDAVTLFESQAKKIDSNVQIELTNPSQKNDVLVKGTNTIQVSVSLNSRSQTVNAKLTNVGLASFMNLINKFKNGIPGRALTAGLSKFKDAAFLIQYITQETFSGATVKLVDSSIKNVSLSAGLVIVKVNITVNGYLPQIVDVKLTNVNKNDDYASSNAVSYILNGIFNNLSNSQLTVLQALDKCNALISHFNYSSFNMHLTWSRFDPCYEYLNDTINWAVFMGVTIDFLLMIGYVYFSTVYYVNFYNYFN